MMIRVVRMALRLFGAWWTIEFARGAVAGFTERRPITVDDVVEPAREPRRRWALAA